MIYGFILPGEEYVDLKKGDTFQMSTSEEIYTADAFFGDSGIEFDTSREAADANNLDTDWFIRVRILETGGTVLIEHINAVKKTRIKI